MVLVTLAWMTQFPGCQNCLDVTTWYATILTDGETDKLLLLRNILMQIGSWWVGSDYLDENGCSGTIKVRNSRPVHVPGPIGSNRSGYGSGIPDLIGPTVDESGWQWMKIDNSGWKWIGGIFTQTETLSNGYTPTRSCCLREAPSKE